MAEERQPWLPPQSGQQMHLGALHPHDGRADWLVPALNEIPGICCGMPEGAFYVMPNMKGLLGGREKNSVELANFLLEQKGVAMTAGSAFGIEGYVRISYATSLEIIQEGVRRIREAAEELRR